MRILHIRWTNLNSLRGSGAVDLETGPLAEAGIFAITGATGSGKSTILDAVTLALYGLAARYEKSAPEQMMSHGTGEAMAAVVFSTRGERYTACWRLKRSRGKADGKLQVPLRDLTHGAAVMATKSAVSAEVERITGLDYDRFLRSVLLAQGQFAAFLRSNRNERSVLLERITGTQVYAELSALAFHKAKAMEENASLAKARSETPLVLSAEEQAEMAEQLPRLEAALAAAKLERAQGVAVVAAGKEQASLVARGEGLKARQAVHVEEMEQAKPHTLLLQRHLGAAPLAPQLRAWEQSHAEQTTARVAMEDARALVEKGRHELTKLAGQGLAVIAEAQQGMRNQRAQLELAQHKHTAAVEALQAWLIAHHGDAALEAALPELTGLAQQWQNAIERGIESRQRLTSETQELANWEQRAEEQKQHTIVAREAMTVAVREVAAAEGHLVKAWPPNINTVAALSASIGTLNSGLTAAVDLERTLAALQEVQERITAHTARLAVGDAALAASATARKMQEGSLAQLRSECQLLQELAQQAEVIRSLEAHREHLEEGLACPLCGALSHPWAVTVPDGVGPAQRLSEAHARLDAEQRAATAAAASHQAMETQQAAHAAELRAQQEQAAALRSSSDQQRRATAGKNQEAWRAAVEEMEGALQRVMTAQSRLATAENLRDQRLHAVELQKERTATLSESIAQCKRREQATQLQAKTHVEEQASAQDNWLRACAPFSSESLDPSAAPPVLIAFQERVTLWRSENQRAESQRREAVRLGELFIRCETELRVWEEHRLALLSWVEPLGLVPAVESSTEGQGWESLASKIQRYRQRLAEVETMAAHESQRLRAVEASTASLAASLQDSCQAAGMADVADLQAALMPEERAATLQAATQRREQEAHRMEEAQVALRADHSRLHAAWSEGIPPDGEARLARAEQVLTELQQQKGVLTERLTAARDAAVHQHRLQEAASQAMAVASPWVRLAELIGSADGRKFARIAQSFTLRHLIVLANARLEAFSGRYEIVPAGDPNVLDLEVQDHWQAAAPRAMESLSGGESFLVSLALALGLSELAGGRTAIQTLFIDEGFGTLDSEALETALTALESLRSGQRTIGIISHMETLKARLPVRIEVVKTGSGWSRIVCPE